MATPEGPARRALRFAAMSAGVTGSYLGYLLQGAFLSEDDKRTKLKTTHTKAARRVTNEMLALRGPAMKLGQALSLHTALLPEETLAELSQLQMRAPGMHPSLVRAQFKVGMGAEPEEIYKRFDPTPFAAASLGQVHHAVTREGERVVVKIQYPGIRDAIENDFKWFRAASKPAQLLRYLPANVLDELQDQILAECDYRREAHNAAFFQRHTTRLPFVELPRIHTIYSSDTVLTMSMVGGAHLDAFLAKRPSQKLRNLVGERLIELYFFQILEMQALHADPHWGNYLFGDDGTIGLVDFGCVKYFQPEFVANLRAVFLYPGSHDSLDFRRLLAERYVGRGGASRRPPTVPWSASPRISSARCIPPTPRWTANPLTLGTRRFWRASAANPPSWGAPGRGAAGIRLPRPVGDRAVSDVTQASGAGEDEPFRAEVCECERSEPMTWTSNRAVRLFAGMLIANVAGGVLCLLLVLWVRDVNGGAVVILPSLMLIPCGIGLTAAWVWRHLDVRMTPIALHALSCTVVGIAGAAVIMHEGTVCLLIASPLLYLFILLGVAIGDGRLFEPVFKPRNIRRSTALLPLFFVVTVAEPMTRVDHTGVVTDEILIHAPPAVVWPHVTAISEIQAPPRFWLFKMGLPMPMSMTVDGDSVGAERRCIFSGGAVFREKVAAFVPNERLTFDIIEQPADPELIGHLTAQRGQFLLRDNHDGTTTLVGSTWYSLHVRPLWYFDAWTRYIFRRVHLRVMENVKAEAESFAARPLSDTHETGR